MSHDHVIGVAGVGMSAIAHVLLDQGRTVSGCDLQRNVLIDQLEARGMAFAMDHAAGHLDGVERLVISSAIKDTHTEVQAARERNIPVLKRAQVWHEWSQQRSTLAVSGTHGKTTTTAIAAVLMQTLGFDPAYIVPAGGPVPGLDGFARWGSGPFVIEADEYDHLFLGLVPHTAIITSVDWDHTDIFPTRADVYRDFAMFALQTQHAIIACADDPGAEHVAAEYTGAAQWLRYGFAPHANWRASDLRAEGNTSHFTLHTPDGQLLPAQLAMVGRHNVQNAVAAIAAVAQFGVSPADAVQALTAFKGAARRMELKGSPGGVTVIDDYAHNPVKIQAALHSARTQYGPERRIIGYHSPNAYSRIVAQMDEFSGVFKDADLVLIGAVRSSREKAADWPGVTGETLAQRIDHHDVRTTGDLEQATDDLMGLVQPGDIVLVMSCNDAYKVANAVVQRLTANLHHYDA